MVVVHENEKFKYIPKQLENMKIKYGTGIKGGNSIYLPRKTFYGETLPITFEPANSKNITMTEIQAKLIPAIVTSVKIFLHQK